jgi:hypothetical protein
LAQPQYLLSQQSVLTDNNRILISSGVWYCLTIPFALLTRIKVLLGKFLVLVQKLCKFPPTDS